MLNLASAILHRGDFTGYHRGDLLTASSAQSFYTASFVVALLLLGHDFFWIFVALAAVFEAGIKRQWVYSMGWWTTIFPLSESVQYKI